MKKVFLALMILFLLSSLGLAAQDEPRDDEMGEEEGMMDKTRAREEGIIRWRDDIARELDELRMKLEHDFVGEEKSIMEEIVGVMEEQLILLDDLLDRGEFEDEGMLEEVERRVKEIGMRHKELWRELDRVRFTMLKERALERGDKGLAKMIKDIEKQMKEEDKLHKKLVDLLEKMDQIKRVKEQLRREVEEQLHEGEMH